MPENAPAVQLPASVRLKELAKVERPRRAWVWEGFIAERGVTLLVSPGKTGKTTLTSILFAKMLAGGTLAGASVAAGLAAVVSEEDPEQWLERAAQIGLGDNLFFNCQPFCKKPSRAEWDAVIDRLAEHHQRDGAKLAVIDTLGAFLPGHDENNAGVMLDALDRLHKLTRLGMAVLVLHHPRKASSMEGRSARGSSTLISFPDIVVEMNPYRPTDPHDRRRRLRCLSRWASTPARTVIELNEAGADYTLLGDLHDADYLEQWPTVAEILQAAECELSRAEIHQRWPSDAAAPNPGTLWRWLDRAVADGLARQSGAGKRGAPLRYWLPSKEAEWQHSRRYAAERSKMEMLDELNEKNEELLDEINETPWGREEEGISG